MGRAADLRLVIDKTKFAIAKRFALAKDVSRRLRVEMRWSVLTTKARIAFSATRGLWRRGVCLELNYRRTITL